MVNKVAGQVTHSRSISVDLTVNTSAYTAGDIIDQVEVANLSRIAGGSGIVTGVTVVDKAGQDAELVFFFLDGTIDNTQTTNAALDLSDDDMDRTLGFIKVDTYESVGSGDSIGFKGGEVIPFSDDDEDTSLHIVVKTNGTPTYTAATDLSIRVHILPD